MTNSKWSFNNLAHRTTYYLLRDLGLITAPLTGEGWIQAKDIKLDTLKIKIPGSSGAMDAHRLENLASHLRAAFSVYPAVDLEPGVDYDKAFELLLGVLKKENATVLDLACVVDDIYRFSNELD